MQKNVSLRHIVDKNIVIRNKTLPITDVISESDDRMS